MNEEGKIIMPLPLNLGCDMGGLVNGLSAREIAANRIMNKKREKGEKFSVSPFTNRERSLIMVL